MNEPSLLAAVLANPADDPARLLFAGAIRARDPERAEFIEVQCELAQRLAIADDDWDAWCGGIALRSRERALLPATTLRQLTFNHREIHVGRTVARTLAGAASLAQLRHLEFSYDHLSPQDLESIASSPRLPELRSITLWDYPRSDVAKRAPQGWIAEGSRLVRERR